jgi:hypothetical protein
MSWNITGTTGIPVFQPSPTNVVVLLVDLEIDVKVRVFGLEFMNRCNSGQSSADADDS